jgi:two-component system, sensor histidine kinase and response regulator
MEPQGDPIDRAALMALRKEAGDAQFFGAIIHQYLEDVPAHLMVLREAAAAGQAETVRKEAHLLKGATSNFNAKSMQALCAQLEQFGRSGLPPHTLEWVAALEKEFGRVRTALEAELEKAV